MKKATLTIIVIFFCCTVYSQDYYSRTFDFGQKRSEIIWSFETYNNDVFASVGYRCDSVPCSYATSIDPLKGSVEWSKLLPWMDPNGRGITRIGEELYFAGHNLLDSNQFYIYKSSLEGDSLALNSYSAHNQFYFPETGAIQSFDSTLILVGAVRDSNTSVEQTAIALWIENEAVIDSMDFIPGNFSNVVYQVQESIIGEIYFFIFYNELNPSNNRHYQILKFNSNRELIWEWESPVDMELDGNMPPRFLVHSNGNIYMTADPRPNTFDGVWILKPDDELIFKTMSDVFNNRYRITKLKEAKDGGILACGSLDGYYLPEGSLAHIFKMDEEGDLLWERIIAENKNEAFGIPNNITLRDLVELENGDLLFGGRQAVWYYDEDNEPRGQNDAWLLRTNSEGCVLEDCGYIQDLLSNTSVSKSPSPFKLFPNPTSGELNFEVPDEISIQSIEVYNNIGQRLGIIDTPESSSIDLRGFPCGLLYLKITDKDSLVWSEKVVKE